MLEEELQKTLEEQKEAIEQVLPLRLALVAVWRLNAAVNSQAETKKVEEKTAEEKQRFRAVEAQVQNMRQVP